MAIRDSLLTSAAEPSLSEQILAELAALASWLSPKAIKGFYFFFFTPFWTYEYTQIFKNQKGLLQKVLNIKCLLFSSIFSTHFTYILC